MSDTSIFETCNAAFGVAGALSVLECVSDAQKTVRTSGGGVVVAAFVGWCGVVFVGVELKWDVANDIRVDSINAHRTIAFLSIENRSNDHAYSIDRRM
jgi:hypothetical protein